MSLTTLIKEKEVRKKLNDVISYPKVDRSVQIKAMPLTRNFTLIGSAFDYLLRFVIESFNDIKAETFWTAHNLCNNIDDFFDVDGDEVQKIIDSAENDYHQFLITKEVSNSLLKSCIQLGKMDLIYRSNTVIDLRAILEDDIQDMQNLYDIINPALWRAKKRYLLNPTFGKGSYLVGGADADLIIDDTLIEIKTVQNFNSYKDHINQLVAYHLLNEFDNRECTEVQIKKIGIYFSRFSVFHEFEITDLISSDDQKHMLSWLKDYCNQKSMIDKMSPATPNESKLRVKAPEKSKSFESETNNLLIMYIEDFELEIYDKYFKDAINNFDAENTKEFWKNIDKQIELLMDSYPYEDFKSIFFSDFLRRVRKAEKLKNIST